MRRARGLVVHLPGKHHDGETAPFHAPFLNLTKAGVML